MKRLVLTAMIAAFSFTAVQAQDAIATKKASLNIKADQEANFEKGLSSLNLSNDQKTKLKELQGSHQLQLAEAKKAGIAQEKLDAIRKDQQEQLMAVLTDTQKEEFKKATAIKPSADNADLNAKIKAIKEDDTLTEAQKKAKVDELRNPSVSGLTEEEKQKIKNDPKHDLKTKPAASKNVN